MRKTEDFRKMCQERQEKYDILPKQTGLVTIEMSGPISTSAPIHLDGLLAYFSLEDTIGEDFYNFNCNEEPEPLDAPLPFERCENDKGWWWTCSAAVYGIEYEAVTRWKKRWDDENDDLVKFPDKRQPRIDHKSGFFKAYDMPIPLRGMKSLQFCFLGNIDAVSHLVKKIRFIGKKRSQGWGQVKSVLVQESAADWYCWNEKKEAMRAIPVDMAAWEKATNERKGIKASMMGYRAPYWHPTRRAYCYELCRQIP